MKEYQGMKIIGIDNGYGNIKTANCCFPAGLTSYDAEPVFKDELLVYGGRYHLIGTGHKEFAADKTGDDDYYLLTLAAVARELNVYGLTSAKVRLAMGLPLTWVSQQREDFKAYLLTTIRQAERANRVRSMLRSIIQEELTAALKQLPVQPVQPEPVDNDGMDDTIMDFLDNFM